MRVVLAYHQAVKAGELRWIHIFHIVRVNEFDAARQHSGTGWVRR